MSNLKPLKNIIFSNTIFSQFIRFIVVGLFNTFLGFSIFALITFFDFNASNALILTYIIAVPLNFCTTGKLVFDDIRLKIVLRFIVLYILIFSINLAMLKLVMNIGLGQLLAQAVIAPLIAVLSFLIFKYIVFIKS